MARRDEHQGKIYYDVIEFNVINTVSIENNV